MGHHHENGVLTFYLGYFSPAGKVEGFIYFAGAFFFKNFLRIMGSAKKRLVVLTGAGISAESGLKTFRDSDGLWEGYEVTDVATPGAWRRDPQLVLDFYNLRRRDVGNAKPNPAHFGLAELEKDFDVHIITQNIDDLHERAGSTKVMHLHGEIFKMRSETDESLVYAIRDDIRLGHLAGDGGQLRPHIVWFEEPVPLIGDAIPLVRSADIFVVVGTSLVVYPAAGLVDYALRSIPKFIVDKKIPYISSVPNLTTIEQPASTGVGELRQRLADLSFR
jgi:NAD-dependent deacetylase